MKKLWILFWGLLTCIGLIACQSPNATSSHSSSVYENESTEVENIGTDSEASGIITMNINDDTVRLSYIDSDTGEWRKDKTFSTPSISGYEIKFSRDIRTLSPLSNRQAFDADYNKIAVSIRRFEDNTRQVGYIDENGELVNVSEKLYPDRNQFSSPPHMDNPKISADG